MSFPAIRGEVTARGLFVLAAFLTLLAPSRALAAFGPQLGAEGFAVIVKGAGVVPGGPGEAGAGEHPRALKVKLALKDAGEYSDGDLRDLHLELPPGFLVNPTAVPNCTQVQFAKPRTSPYEASASGESCPNQSQVGTLTVRAGPGGATVRTFGVFNLAPPYGRPGAFGASPYGVPVVLAPHVREADAGLTLDLASLSQAIDFQALELTLWGTPWEYEHDGERGNCLNEADPAAYHGELATPPPNFKAGTCTMGGPAELAETAHSYLTLPTSPCGEPLSFALALRSWQGGEAGAETTAFDGEGHSVILRECRSHLTVPKLQLTTEAAASPSGLVFNLDVNDGGGILNPGGIARPAIKQAIVTLPEGVTINPSLGAGLGVCSEADFAREALASAPGAGCPNAAKIGTIEVQGMLGLGEPVAGSLFLATPYENRFGTLLALYMVARNQRRGIFVRSVGKVEPDPQTGRLVATFDELPRLLYTHFSLAFREGQRAALASPPACGDYPTDVQLASWAEPSAFSDDATSYLPIRTSCPPSPRPFAPSLLAGSVNPSPGAYTPFDLRMSRGDGEAEITSYSATFPPGLLGKIAGIPFCPDAAIAAAAGRSGTAELAEPSCPEASRVGRTLAGYGLGGTLAWAPGGLYLAGPYHGAPLSIVAIDSALVGPFDLGVVVVRSAIRIDPRTAQASIDSSGSDPIPHLLKGIPLHLRDIRVYVDRPGFTLNPTSCDVLQTTSLLAGAGADPFDPADDGSASSGDRYQLLGCSGLGFKPRLSFRLRGSTRHGAYPALRATYTPRPGDANLRAVAVTMPHALFLAQEHIDKVCTRVRFSAGACPTGSVYGSARAVTPLLDEPLEGPVYLRSSSHAVPDLVADLRGRGIEIEVPARIDSKDGGIRASFEGLPDAPVSSFTMNLFGGKRGLLSNAESLCAPVRRVSARFVAQSNATSVLRPRLVARCRKPKRGKRSRRAQALAEPVQRGKLRVSFSGKLWPDRLPRKGVAPVSVQLGGRISTTDGSDPPALRRLEIAVNRNGHLDPAAVPRCRLQQIQPASTEYARRVCGAAQVGEGSFSAAVSIPGQSPYPSRGAVTAFNARERGRPVILLHIYGTKPLPTSFTLPLQIRHSHGQFGTVLSGELPLVDVHVGFVTGISLRLDGGASKRGRRPYLSAGCPAPKGFSVVPFTLARASFGFAHGPTLATTLVRSCRVRE